MHIKYFYTHFFSYLLSQLMLLLFYNNAFSALCCSENNRAIPVRMRAVQALQDTGRLHQ